MIGDLLSYNGILAPYLRKENKMTTILERAHLARRAGRVTRFHTQFLLKPENVAEHTFGLLNLLMIMTGGQVTGKLLMDALAHDAGEYVSGDMPSPSKRAMGPDAKGAFEDIEFGAMQMIYDRVWEPLTSWEALLLKTADNLDGLLKCIEEKRMGNYTIEGCGENYAAYLSSQLPALGGGPAAELVQLVLTEWHWSHK
jgi:5'-deoxynucleotidase YfbR-like HD superfamily hydrolase